MSFHKYLRHYKEILIENEYQLLLNRSQNKIETSSRLHKVVDFVLLFIFLLFKILLKKLKQNY